MRFGRRNGSCSVALDLSTAISRHGLRSALSAGRALWTALRSLRSSRFSFLRSTPDAPKVQFHNRLLAAELRGVVESGLRRSRKVNIGAVRGRFPRPNNVFTSEGGVYAHQRSRLHICANRSRTLAATNPAEARQ